MMERRPMLQPGFDDLLLPSQVAELADCHYDTVARAIKKGDLPVALTAGRSRLIRKDLARRWADSRVDARRLAPEKAAEVRKLLGQGKADLFIQKLTGVNRETVGKMRRRLDDAGD
jgi:excisionase family DNA binding protein